MAFSHVLLVVDFAFVLLHSLALHGYPLDTGTTSYDTTRGKNLYFRD
jgi:hypothetical protein